MLATRAIRGERPASKEFYLADLDALDEAGQLAPARAPPYARCAHRVPVCGQGGPKPPKLPIAMQCKLQCKLSTTGEGSATAVVNRSCERSEEGMEEGAARTTKRIAIAPCRSAGGWFHVAVNIAAA